MIKQAEVKAFELRDQGTFIPVLCVHARVLHIEEPDRYLVRRGGWGADQEFVYMININDSRCQYDPFKWRSEPYLTAHLYIREHWDELQGGEVIDAEFLRGERPEPKTSERLEEPLLDDIPPYSDRCFLFGPSADEHIDFINRAKRQKGP